MPLFEMPDHGQRQPGIDIANMRNRVPQRTTQPTGPNIGFDRAGPVRARGVQAPYQPTTPGVSGYGRNMSIAQQDMRDLGQGSAFGRGQGYQRAGPATGLVDYEDYIRRGLEPMGSGDFLASKYGGGLDDVAGMNEGAMGMLEGAGFDVAGKTTDDRVIEKLWGKAVNSLPAGTPQMEIEKEWERLKAIYFDKKYTS